MGILKDIWNTFFGKKSQDSKSETGCSIEEHNPLSNYKGNQDEIRAGRTYTENELGEPVVDKVSEPKKESTEKPRVRGFKNLTKEQGILKHLLEHGSIDKITCAQKFGLKRLDNFICELRKQGMNIVNETILLHNEKGEKVKVNNYRLIKENGTN